MKRDSKLSLALHVLGHMAVDPSVQMRSETIARHHATHAVVVRRTLGLLRDAGIVASARGHAGGWRLARPAGDISVADVYLGLQERLDPAPGRGAENQPGCAIERALHGHWDRAVEQAQTALIAGLAGVTIADLAQSVTTALPPE